MPTAKPKKINLTHAYSDGFYDGRDDKPSREALCTGPRVEHLYLRGYEAGQAHKKQDAKPS